MKKLVLLFLSVISLGVNAQSIHLIPKVGFDHSYMTDLDGVIFKPGLVIGAGTEFMLGPILAIEPGIYYAMQGYKAETKEKVDIKLSNNYLNIPVYAKLYIINGFHIYGGPQASFRLNTKADISSGQTHLGADIEKITNDVDISGIIGVGLQTRIGLLLSANYNIGLLDVYKKKVTVDGHPIEVRDLINPKNRVIQFNIGWRF